MTLNLTYQCSICGDTHVDSPSYSFNAPSVFVKESNFFIRLFSKNYLNTDFCKFQEGFYIRAILNIPIIGSENFISWGVWVSQSENNYQQYYHTFNEDLSGRETFGRFANLLPGYNNTLGIKASVLFQESGFRPILHIEEGEDELSKDFYNGISLGRAQMIISSIHHDFSE